MPTYEYECTTCGHVCDVSHSMTAKPRVRCPECGGRTKKRIGAGAGIIFKGSGFYETDYKRKSNSNGGDKSRSEVGAPKPAESKPGEKKSEEKKAEKPKEEKS